MILVCGARIFFFAGENVEKLHTRADNGQESSPIDLRRMLLLNNGLCTPTIMASGRERLAEDTI